MNQVQKAAYSNNMTAIRAVDSNGYSAAAYIRFMPQTTAEASSCLGSPCPIDLNIDQKTMSTDPLLTSKYVFPLHRLPDLSTPLNLETTPKKYMDEVKKQMLNDRGIVNEAASFPNGEVPMLTDWVISQLLLRYSHALRYGASEGETEIVTGEWEYGGGGLVPERIEQKTLWANMGPFLCVSAGYSPGITASTLINFYDREGAAAVDITGEYPGICGAVSTIGFAQESPLAARVARTVLTPPSNNGGAEGWASLTGTGAAWSHPVTGFAAFSAKNEQTGIFYSTTWAHR